MKNISVLIIFFLCLFTDISANSKSIPFRLVIPETLPVVSESLYNQIELIDDRNTMDADFISIDGVSFSSQLNSFVRRITDKTAKNNTLFLQLRNLTLKQEKNDKESIHLRMSLYEKVNDSYFYINTFDSKIPIMSPNEYLNIVSKKITDFITENLTQNYTDNRAYSIDDIYNISFLEKENLKVYNTHTFADGIYINYKKFADQTPEDRPIIPKFKNDELKEVKIYTKDNKQKKIYPERIYAVVVDGRPYLSYKKKFVALNKVDDNFCFEAEVNRNRTGIAPSFSIGIGSGGYRGGGFGIGIMTHTQKEKITYIIDHLNGDIIPLYD